jgi:uncharacterized protein
VSPWLLGVLDTGPTGQLVVALGAFSPAIAAIIVRRWVTREGFADAGLRLNLRHKWRYYLFAWLLPLPVVGVIAILAAAAGIPPVRSLAGAATFSFACWAAGPSWRPSPPG